MAVVGSRLAVTGLGMATCLGTDAAAACAAARAGITRFSDSSFVVVDRAAFEVVPVTGAAVHPDTLGFAELGLWVRLGGLALANLIEGAGPAEHFRDAAVLLGAPGDYYLRAAAEHLARSAPPGEPADDQAQGPSYQELQPYYAGELAPKIFRAAGLEPPAVHQVFFQDEMGFLEALGRAAELLRSGVERCIVGGVDSLLEPHWLTAANDLGILKTAVRPVGFMPGEAAALLLVETAATARRRKAKVLGFIEAPSIGTDRPRFAGDHPQGMVLASVIQGALGQTARPCTGFICDLNGHAVRANEWGIAQVRLKGAAPAATIIPATSFGETRAAYPAVAACMALRAFARGYHPSDPLLVWTAADHGGRGSFLVARSELT